MADPVAYFDLSEDTPDEEDTMLDEPVPASRMKKRRRASVDRKPRVLEPKVKRPAAPPLEFTDIEAGPPPVVPGFEGDPVATVKEQIRIFGALRRKLAYQEEERVRKGLKKLHKRPDLAALTVMNRSGVDTSWPKVIGHYPGVTPGDQFHYRVELNVIGMHRHTQGGIDYIGKDESPYGKHVATSVIASGGYEDDVDEGEEFIYTGQGGQGQAYFKDRKQTSDQELVRGNLALYNNAELKLPVRVVRSLPESNSVSGKVLTYDGLYYVEKAYTERGKQGKLVWKFKLVRASGQPPLTSSRVDFMMTSFKPTMTVEDREGVVVADISGGLEKYPVCAVNKVDDDPAPPPAYKYIVKHELPPDFKEPPAGQGCKCKKACTDPKVCACAQRNLDGEFPYNSRGHLMGTDYAIYECGPSCGCGPECKNRVAQKGTQFRFEVFKTEWKGWGLRSWDAIPAGAPICEYIGRLLTDEEAESLGPENDDYLFNIDSVGGGEFGDVGDLLQKDQGNGGGERDEAGGAMEEIKEQMMCIDAAHTANMARFINHSCEPNALVQPVFWDTHDPKFGHLVIYASRDIAPLEEITYDYKYKIGEVYDAEGNVRSKDCHCKAATCRERLF